MSTMMIALSYLSITRMPRLLDYYIYYDYYCYCYCADNDGGGYDDDNDNDDDDDYDDENNDHVLFFLEFYLAITKLFSLKPNSASTTP